MSLVPRLTVHTWSIKAEGDTKRVCLLERREELGYSERNNMLVDYYVTLP